MDEESLDPEDIGDEAGGEESRRIVDRRPVLASADFSPDGKTLLTAGWNGVLAAWDAKTGRRLEALLEPDDPDLLSPWSEGTQARPDAQGRIRVARLREWLRGWSLTAVRFSPDGKWFAVGGWNGFVVLWDSSHLKEINAFQAHLGGISALALSPNRRLMATGSRVWGGENVQVWKVPARPGGSFRKVFANSKHAAGVRTMRFSPKGRYLVAVGVPLSSYTPPLVFRAGTGRLKSQMEWDVSWPAEFSPRGFRIATGNDFGGIKIWAWKRNRVIREIRAHAGMIWALSWSPDGRMLASGGDDGVVRLWNVRTGTLIQGWPIPGRVLACRFAQGDRALWAASAAEDPDRPEIRRLI